MNVTRADFLKSMAAGAGAAFCGLSAFGSDEQYAASRAGNLDHLSTTERNRRLGELLSKDRFTQHLKSTFQISNESSPTVLDVQLIEVCEGRSTERIEQFSVLFTGPKEPLLKQGTYRFEHAAMGSFGLFIVPISSDEGGTLYEAVFGRKLQ